MSAPLRLDIGIHDNVPAADYHKDPGLDPTLSSSIAKILVNETPRHARAAHPRLNPNFEPEVDAKFSLGSVVHELILGRGGGYRIIEADSWQTKAAKEARDLAHAEGSTPILAHQFETAERIVSEVKSRLWDVPEAKNFGIKGFAERVLVWRDIGGPLCRAMIDWHGAAETDIWDIKTTGVSLADESLGRLIENLGYDLQAAFYLRGLCALLPDLARRFKFRWIFVENDEPFEVRVKEASGETLSLGDRKAALAIEKWRRCLERDLWPGWPPVVTRTSPSSFAIERWMAREMVDDDALAMIVSYRPSPSRSPELLGPV